MIHKFERFKFKITRYDLNLNLESNLKLVTNLILYICVSRVEESSESKIQEFYSFTSTHINVCEPDSLRRILWHAKSCKRFLNLDQMSISQEVDSKC